MPLSDILRSYHSTSFSVEDGDFSSLEIRDAGHGNGFHYFFDTRHNHLVTDFVLEEGQKVATLCRVTLIRLDGKYSPRIRLWKVDKTKIGREPAVSHADAAKLPKTVAIKALVDANSCHDNFWKVIGFLVGLGEIEVPVDKFRMIDGDQADLIKILEGHNKDSILQAVKTAVGNNLTEADLQLLAGRKSQLEHFERLLSDNEYFEAEKERRGVTSTEAVWQKFFEENTWIFGYGLSLISCESLDDSKLEQITTGANVFTGAGKRSDAVMKTRGYIGSLLFAEIKTPETMLLATAQYRPPDVYRPSNELSGGVSQIQKTVNKATRTLASYMDRLYSDDGTPQRVELSTIRPRQVLVIGHQKEFTDAGGINLEKSLSFELFRKSVNDVEVITFDELLERARFIVRDA